MITVSEKVKILEKENEQLKNEMDIMKQLCGDDYKPMRCQECKHFCQHYGKCGNHYYKIDAGHCMVGKRTKKKRAEDERCQFFQERKESYI